MTPNQWMTFILIAVITLVGVACGGSTESASAPVPTDVPTTGPALDSREADALRQLAFAYWEAFNAYDADRTLGYLEESYRQKQEDEIRNEIGLIELFGVQLEVSEKSPPQVVSEDEREMYLDLKEPLGTRKIRMAFRRKEGEWKIIFAEEQR